MDDTKAILKTLIFLLGQAISWNLYWLQYDISLTKGHVSQKQCIKPGQQ